MNNSQKEQTKKSSHLERFLQCDFTVGKNCQNRKASYFSKLGCPYSNNSILCMQQGISECVRLSQNEFI